MEQQNTQEAQVPVSTPIQPVTPSPKNKLPLILIGLLVLVLATSGAYYLGSRKVSDTTMKRNAAEKSTTPSPAVQVSQSPVPSEQTSKLPAEWIYVLSNACNVNLPLPPKKAPYYIPDDPSTNPDTVDTDGAFWQVENTTDTQPKTMFKNESRVIYSNPKAGGSGYVPGVVDVKCDVNTDIYTTQTLLAKFEKNFTDGTYSGISLGSKEIVSMWGKQVAKVTIKGGMYDNTNPEYLLATPAHIYRIASVSMSQSKVVKDTTQTILNNLEFKE